ncbi:MAG: histidine ammonia-lyase [Anaerolineae bacterium]|nr:MAG: histidine ammonia-lyase [Anaerolineae bacterium]
MNSIALDGEHLTLEDVMAVASAPLRGRTVEVRLSEAARQKVRRAQQAVQDLIARREVVYGVSTGFGAFKDRIIPPEGVQQLQRNILMSHAVGVGEPLDEVTTRAMMLIRANTLAKGYSGIREETLRLLLEMLNRGVHPVVPSQGSLGASGDLAPLAHMSLPFIGLGEAVVRGQCLSGAEALAQAGLSPVTLEAKEGLALTNGTAFMAAVGVLATCQAENLACVADVAGCLSLEALHGTPRAFDARIHAVRPHPRQVECAAFLRQLIEGSTFTRPDDPLNVQDAYTLRCIPQVHGAVRDAILYARWVLNIELNAATDNPLIFFDEETSEVTVLSGGNFHGEPLAIAMDYLALALTELGSMSERRLTRLTDECSNREALPAFLIQHGGLNSGFMMTQYTAAALASENKVLAHPASVDTIPTSANAEDHVSMGATAARQARQIAANVERILALELFAAAQGIDFRRQALGPEAQLGRGTAPAYELIRQHVPFLDQDAVMYPCIEAIRELVANRALMRAVKGALPQACEAATEGRVQ